jgi:hypothetical protein
MTSHGMVSRDRLFVLKMHPLDTARSESLGNVAKAWTEILSHISLCNSGIGRTIQKKRRLAIVVECGAAAAPACERGPSAINLMRCRFRYCHLAQECASWRKRPDAHER